jgi:hypothetical protein
MMAALRRVAMGVSVDGLVDMAGLSKATLHCFTSDWEQWFVERYYDKWVKLPEGSELHEAVELFRRDGLPGCVSSMDVVHVRYDRCPAQQRSLHAGKEGYPTLGFQFHCCHNRHAYYVSEAIPGARNDKAIVRFDTFQDDMFKARDR